MGDYVHMSTPPISNADTRILGNILLDRPDKTRDYNVYSQYYYLVNGKFPTQNKSLLTRSIDKMRNIKFKTKKYTKQQVNEFDIV